MGRPIHFEIPADDPKRAATFYETALGWRIARLAGEKPYWTIETGDGPGIDGGIGARERDFRSPAVVVQVDDLDSTVTRSVDAGGEIVYPRHAIPDVGWAAYLKDTEGNVFGLIELDARPI